jgi:hypothetical protein
VPETAVRKQKPQIGREHPRLSPPTPARSGVEDFTAVAHEIGIDLYPWQKTAARYLTAKGRGDSWLYRHVAVVVARQSGKTTLLVPLIVSRLRAGHRIMHTAQDRNLPREIHAEVAEIMGADPDALAKRNGKVIMPRFASGQEEIRMANGGVYQIVAPTRGGARGPARDLVIIDELREMDTHEFIAAAGPTVQASPHPQMVYLSNAGDDTSVILNELRSTADTDPSLAYLEWSAAPERSVDDVEGWLEANPSIGHDPSAMANLQASFVTYQSRGSMAIFETEHLCRWVVTMRDRFVGDVDWIRCRADIGKPERPAIGVSIDPDGRRATVAMAWREGERIALTIVEDFAGDPVDTDAINVVVRDLERRHGAKVGHEPFDAELVKGVRKGHAESITGQKFAAASAQFAMLVASGRLAWSKADALTDDLTWTSRTPPRPDGGWSAMRAQEDKPITASLASIRAVWLASQPKSEGRLMVR